MNKKIVGLAVVSAVIFFGYKVSRAFKIAKKKIKMDRILSELHSDMDQIEKLKRDDSLGIPRYDLKNKIVKLSNRIEKNRDELLDLIDEFSEIGLDFEIDTDGYRKQFGTK